MCSAPPSAVMREVPLRRSGSGVQQHQRLLRNPSSARKRRIELPGCHTDKPRAATQPAHGPGSYHCPALIIAERDTQGANETGLASP